MSIRVLNDDHIQFITELISVKEALSRLNNSKKLSFTTEIPISIKNVIKENIGLDLTNIKDVPMTWIVGDSLPHVDRGERHFETTYLIYLTDSEGELIVDSKSFPIKKGHGLVFNEGLTHETRNSGIRPRLLIGPMSEYGFGVGVVPRHYGLFFYTNTGEAFLGRPWGTAWLYRDQTTANNQLTIPLNKDAAFGYGDRNVFAFCRRWKLMYSSYESIALESVYNNGSTNFVGTSVDLQDDSVIFHYYNFGPANDQNICFPSGTPVETDQGEIPIEKIDPKINTIRGCRIVALTENENGENPVALLKKDIISENCPCRDTICSIWHKIEYDNKMIEAQTVPGAIALKYDSKEILYNILMEKHQTMRVNNMTVETLDPKSPGAVFCVSKR